MEAQRPETDADHSEIATEASAGQSATGSSISAGRRDHLLRITDSALGYMSLEDMLSELLERIREALEVDTAAVLLLDEDRGVLLARAAQGLEEVRQGVQVPLARGFAGRIAAEARPIIIDLEHAEVVNPILRQKGIRSMLGGWAYGAIYRDSTQRTAALSGWLDFYNWRRPHGSLSHRPPGARLAELNNVAGSYKVTIVGLPDVIATHPSLDEALATRRSGEPS